MKTNVRYSVKRWLQRNEANSLHKAFAECSCSAGVASSACKHVGAACYGVEELCKRGVFEGVTSCTSDLQRWNAPAATRKTADMQFVHPKCGKRQEASD